ncbi:S1 RNA-binding domain-containing protein [Merismopedia glauca]|uniref:30S ribosomal protein S1 n=1 Tax=Merismopedia glauca CCAP 1448/3 TaxID=1296344 RepID=A0A2T1BY42_9CYAN|nr:S1 RNA-binding domain-containing protein [Merismopedia glauca]PSB00922.1 30S ribosomal protein S1 [Merismopedia glauca CCAP 1448/3]
MTSSSKANIPFSMDDFAKALEQQEFDFSTGQVVQGKVHSYDTNGVYVEIGGKSLAFVPQNEVGLKNQINLEQELPLQSDQEFLIIKESNADGQVTLSRRRLAIKQTWDRLAQMQENKQSITVRVTGVNKGGVTVDAEGLRGFVPRSHLVDKENLEQLVGQILTVTFLDLNSETQKLVLSQREAVSNASFGEWELGQLVTGKVVSIKPFGVFVDLDGTTALLHIKQVSQSYIESLSNIFQVGQEVKAIAIDVDEAKRRLSISTRVLENHPGEMLENMAEVMASAEDRAHRAAKKVLGES